MPQPPFLNEETNKRWRMPLAMTIGVHLLVFLFGLFGPGLFDFQPKTQEIHTVSLFSAEDLRPPGAAAPAQADKLTAQAPAETVPSAAQAPPPPSDPVQKKVTAEPEAVKPPPKVPETPEIADKTAVSLKPIKSKTEADLERVKKLRDKLLEANRESLARAEAEKAIAAAQKARVVADQKAKGAVDSLKQALKAGQQLAGQAGGSGSATSTGTAAVGAAGPGVGAGGGGSPISDNLLRYLVAVNGHIQERWILPDTQNWKANVEAVVIIRVRRDGMVLSSNFKKKSDNQLFNQFVEKTLKASSPLPPFPIGLNDQEMEIGLKFRPGEIL